MPRSSKQPIATKPSSSEPTRVAPAERPSRVQMADIARLAGVSTSTVSRALADSPLVNAETRARVTELARSLNYSINIGAQNLRLKQNRSIAVIVPSDPITHESLSEPFFLSLLGSLADAVTATGHDMLVTRIDADHLDQAAQPWRTGRASGVVLVGQWHHHDQLNAMAVQGVPFVVWGAQLPQQLYTTIGSDNIGGGELATSHLIGQGAKRILFLGDADLPEIGQRMQGWRLAHERASLSIDPRLERPVPFVTEAIQSEVRSLVKHKLAFDAVFASSDLMAMTVISTLRSLGRDVPRDVLVVGYDDIALAEHFAPPLTTVRQPVGEAGALLIDALLRQLDGERVGSRLLRTELVVRGSSVRPAA